MSTNIWCTLRSDVSSGWNDAASTVPWRTSTGTPSRRANTSTSSPADTTRGARMKTAGSGGPPTASSASKDCCWRPYPLRRTTTSTSPKECWSGRPSSTWRATSTRPAQVPSRGRPSAAAAWTASNRPVDDNRKDSVVDSPPGSTRPDRPDKSAGRLTLLTAQPNSPSTATCSRTSPCRSSTPTSPTTPGRPGARRTATPPGRAWPRPGHVRPWPRARGRRSGPWPRPRPRPCGPRRTT